MKNKEEIIEFIDKTINELVYDKNKVIKAYNYYHGVMDSQQFRHLEENYGIGTPTSVEFIPLVRKHIDVLVGEYLSTPIMPKISCKDSRTLSNIHKEKKDKIISESINILKKHIKESVKTAIEGENYNADIEKELSDLISDISENFISSYEIAGQNILEYLRQARNIDLLNKRKTMLLDLLICGLAYYRVIPSPNNTNVEFTVLNPVNTFVERNPEHIYLKKSSRAVIRQYYTKQQILRLYGNLLNKEDVDLLDETEDMSYDYSSVFVSSTDGPTGVESPGILGGLEITPTTVTDNNYNRNYRVYPVYTVEWLKTEKEGKEYITNRYEGIRIGTKIYIPTGKSENVVRSMDDPRDCDLSINGIFFSDRNGDPISLVLSTANLQDKYNCLHFYRDNVIAESGAVGDWVDVAHLPAFLGAEVTERLVKWKAYKKSGLALYDSSQEGDVINTAFNGYDDTIKLQTIQAIELAIQRTEETCSSITGVFRERLGGIEQRDAVTNVAVGVKNSSYITKHYYQIADLLTRDCLLDMINIAKIVYKNGITGTLVLGEKLNKIFTALPEHYTITDFDVHINDSSEMIQEQELIKELAMVFVKSGIGDPDIMLDMVTAKSLTGLKSDVSKSLAKKKAENDQLGQLSNQVEQLNTQLKQVSTEAEKLKREIETLNREKMALEREKFKALNELEWFKAKSDDEYKDSKLELDKKRIELEGLQLLDLNKKNDEIRND